MSISQEVVKATPVSGDEIDASIKSWTVFSSWSTGW